MIIRNAGRVEGPVVVPGDKSISHRAVIVAALAEGRTTIENFSSGEDCKSTIRCLKQLGVRIERFDTKAIVDGVGRSGLSKPSEPLDCGNSGTTMRLLAGVLAGQDRETILTGDESLCRRPMDRIIDPLRHMGAEIGSKGGFAPLTIRGRVPLKAIRYKMPVASAQVKSCILLAGLNAEGGTTVIEDTTTRDHTELMLKRFGADVEIFGDLGLDLSDEIDELLDDDFDIDKEVLMDMSGSEMRARQNGPRRIRVLGESKLEACEINIPGDISSAAFFMAAAACLPGSKIEISNVGINTTRSEIINCLLAFGADIEFKNVADIRLEPVADLVIEGREALRSQVVNNLIGGWRIPGIIDEIPILAVLGTKLENGITIRDAGELRHKETDRIAAIVENLRRMRAVVEEFDDGFSVKRSALMGAELDSFGDHRIAMAFAVAGLLAEGETVIRDAGCVDISFPGFFTALESVAVSDQ